MSCRMRNPYRQFQPFWERMNTEYVRHCLRLPHLWMGIACLWAEQALLHCVMEPPLILWARESTMLTGIWTLSFLWSPKVRNKLLSTFCAQSFQNSRFTGDILDLHWSSSLLFPHTVFLEDVALSGLQNRRQCSPQLAYTPHLSGVPKKELKLIQDQLVSIIWKNRPMWRCRWLIIAMLANPHRSEPFLTRAFSTIIEVVFFLKNCTPTERRCWQNQCESDDILPNSLLGNFRQACEILNVSHTNAFHLAFFDAQPVCFLDFGKRELSTVLKIVVRHQSYKFATDIVRKDIKPCEGFLNYQLEIQGNLRMKLLMACHLNASGKVNLLGVLWLMAGKQKQDLHSPTCVGFATKFPNHWST